MAAGARATPCGALVRLHAVLSQATAATCPTSRLYPHQLNPHHLLTRCSGGRKARPRPRRRGAGRGAQRRHGPRRRRLRRGRSWQRVPRRTVPRRRGRRGARPRPGPRGRHAIQPGLPAGRWNGRRQPRLAQRLWSCPGGQPAAGPGRPGAVTVPVARVVAGGRAAAAGGPCTAAAHLPRGA